MLGDGIGSSVRKSKLINRRMFLASAAKAVVFFWNYWSFILFTSRTE